MSHVLRHHRQCPVGVREQEAGAGVPKGVRTRQGHPDGFGCGPELADPPVAVVRLAPRLTVRSREKEPFRRGGRSGPGEPPGSEIRAYRGGMPNGRWAAPRVPSDRPASAPASRLIQPSGALRERRGRREVSTRGG